MKGEGECKSVCGVRRVKEKKGEKNQDRRMWLISTERMQRKEEKEGERRRRENMWGMKSESGNRR